MNIKSIYSSISTHKEALLNHSLYSKINSPADLNIFLEFHVFAVWDFMSLLKALQQKLTCVTTPWKASPNPETRYLINEIVTAEESDLSLDGKRLSHYEMYIEAMNDSKASIREIELFLADVEKNQNIFLTIENSNLNQAIKNFLNFTFEVINEGKPHKIAAAFTFGREDLIPAMFTEILKNFRIHFPEANLSKLIYYFERHIELDGDEHGPMAMKMIEELAQNDPIKWREIEETAIAALNKRIELWNAIEVQIVAL